MGQFSQFAITQMLSSLLMPSQAVSLASDDGTGSVYIALTTSIPLLGAPGNKLVEPQSTTYARKEYGLGADYWVLEGGRAISNAKDIAWDTPTEDWKMVRGWAMCTAATAGIVIASGALSNPFFIKSGTQPVVPTGALRMRME